MRSFATLAFVLVACTVGPKYRVPSSPQPIASAYKEAGRGGPWRVANPSDAMLRGDWWKVFGDPELDQLEAELRLDNQTIAQAFANYMVARAEVRAAHAQYFPTIGVAPSATTGRAAGGGLGNSATATTTGTATPATATPLASSSARVTTYTLPIEASWAPDIWGRVRNAVRAAQANAQVSAADLESQRLLEQATLAETFFELRGQDAMEDILDATVNADADIARYARAQFDTGIGTEIAMVQADQTYQTALVAATASRALRAQYEHAIATLIGAPATTFSIPHRAALVAPPAIPAGTPSRLLERRPDVAAAERQVAAANAQIGVGVAAYYPDLTLTATAGFASSALGSLLSWPNRVWSVGATVSETVFDGGLRRAQLDEYIATYNAAVAGYRQTVLTAFQQVEDGLSQTSILAQQVEQQQRDVELADRAVELERVRYETGVDPYIDLMQEQTLLFTARQTLVILQVQEMVSAITLVQALGGGWQVGDLPTAKQVSGPPEPNAREIEH
jgi:NodT family efflux transporter outer membrane factor (OMF) lipoprotein